MSLNLTYCSYPHRLLGYLNKFLNDVNDMLTLFKRFFITAIMLRMSMLSIIRCSKDVDYLDSNLPVMVRNFLYVINPLIATIVIVSYSTPIFLAVVVPVGVVYFFAQVGFRTFHGYRSIYLYIIICANKGLSGPCKLENEQ